MVVSLLILKQAPVEVAFRTTCIPHLVAEAEVDTMGELLQGVPLWVLQQYVPLHAMVEEWQQFDIYQPHNPKENAYYKYGIERPGRNLPV